MNKKVLAAAMSGALLSLSAALPVFAQTDVNTSVNASVNVAALSAQLATIQAQINARSSDMNASSSASADVAVLMAKLEAIRAQIAARINGTGVTGGNCFAFGRDLMQGSRGEEVRALQRLLAEDPTIFASSNVTGTFGPITKAALIKFQTRAGIRGTGYFGPISRSHVRNRCASAGGGSQSGFINGRLSTSTGLRPPGAHIQSYGPPGSNASSSSSVSQ